MTAINLNMPVQSMPRKTAQGCLDSRPHAEQASARWLSAVLNAMDVLYAKGSGTIHIKRLPASGHYINFDSSLRR